MSFAASLVLLTGAGLAFGSIWLRTAVPQSPLRLVCAGVLVGGIALLVVTHGRLSLTSVALLVGTGLWIWRGTAALALVVAGLAVTTACDSLGPTAIGATTGWQTLLQYVLAVGIPLAFYVALAQSLSETGNRTNPSAGVLIASSALCLAILPAELGALTGSQTAQLHLLLKDGNLGQQFLRSFPVRFSPDGLINGRMILVLLSLFASASLLLPIERRWRSVALGSVALGSAGLVILLLIYTVIAPQAVTAGWTAETHAKLAALIGENETLTRAWLSAGGPLSPSLRAAPTFSTLLFLHGMLCSTFFLYHFKGKPENSGNDASDHQPALWFAALVASVGILGVSLHHINQGLPIISPQPGAFLLLVASIGALGSWAADRFAGVPVRISAAAMGVTSCLWCLAAINI